MTYQELESHCGNCPNQFKCMAGFDYFTWGKGVIKTDFECEYQSWLTEYLTGCINDQICKIIQNSDGSELIMDCNNCEHLNITEAEQKQRGNHIHHICTKYNQRVLHRATNKIHNEYIYPCDKCLKENNNGI